MRYILTVMAALLLSAAVWAGPVGSLKAGRALLTGAPNAAGVKTGIRLGDRSLVPYEGDGLSCRAGSATAEFTLTELSRDESAVSVRARVPRDLAGAGWGVAVKDKGVRIFVPQYSGACYDADSIEGEWQFSYPVDWEAQFVLIQKQGEGWLIHADDDMQYWKTLQLSHKDGVFALNFETNTQAPFDGNTSLDSCPWRVVRYKGDWLAGANLYREWADKKFGLSELNKTKPKWTEDIDFVVNDYSSDTDTSLLEELAELVDPARTLVYFPIWRAHPYDNMYPDYEPSPAATERIKKAKSLGFRVMVHTNYFGLSPFHPLYPEFAKYHLRDPYGKNTMTVEVPGAEIAYIDPASKAWRELFVSRAKKAVEELQLDALFTDQTLVMYNDANGLIDGMNMMQGNLEEHRLLREALPDVALAGEGLDEITCRYESFAQRHLLGADYFGMSVNPFMSALASPVSGAVFSPYTRPVGYLGIPRVEQTELMKDWMYVYDRYAVIPTLPIHKKEERDRYAFMYDYIVNLGRIWQKYAPRMCLDPAAWGKNTVMVYDARSGERLEVREEKGLRGLWDGKTLLTGKVTGVERFRTGRVLYEAAGYKSGEYFALDPDKKYLLGEEAPAESAVSDKTAVELFEKDNLVLFRAGTRRMDLLRYKDVYTGHRMDGGETVLFRSPSCSTEENAKVEWSKDRLYIHPPFKMKSSTSSEGKGRAVALWKNLSLPSCPCRFEALAGMRNEEGEQKSDGARYYVKASCGDKVLETSLSVFTVKGEPLVLDLTPFRGKKIDLEISVDPGPARDTSYDFTCLQEPAVCEKLDGFDFEIKEDKGYTFAAAGAKGSLTRTDGGVKVHTTVPEGFVTSWEPTDFEPGPVDWWYQYQTTPEGLEIVTERRNLTDSRFEVAGGETYLLDSHPPRVGRNIFARIGRVPGSVKSFRVKCAVRDEAADKSEGVLFAIAVNGEIQKSLTVIKQAGWRELEADLTGWQGKTVYLEIFADSMKDNYFDWAVFSEPEFR